jgi:hypothetical protein
MSEILNAKGIQHWLDDRKWCGHDWNYWREMLPYYLSTFQGAENFDRGFRGFKTSRKQRVSPSPIRAIRAIRG